MFKNLNNYLVVAVFLAVFCVQSVGAQTTHRLYVFVDDLKGDVEVMKAGTLKSGFPQAQRL